MARSHDRSGIPLQLFFEKSENALLAVRPPDAGNPAQAKVVWKQKRGLPYVPSPLVYQDRIYLVKNGGLATCYRTSDGEPLFQEERLDAGGNYYSSPIAAGGKICVISQHGMATILKAGDSFAILAHNDLQEQVMATPAIADNTLYVRTKEVLYAFGQKNLH